MAKSAGVVRSVKEPEMIIPSDGPDPTEIVVIGGSLDDELIMCTFRAPQGTNTVGKKYHVTIEEVTDEE